MEVKQSKDVCIEKLTSTSGQDLEITSNINHPGQMGVMIEGYVCRALNVAYGVEKYQMLLRLTCAWRGRARDDLTGIGKVPDQVPGWNINRDDQ